MSAAELGWSDNQTKPPIVTKKKLKLLKTALRDKRFLQELHSLLWRPQFLNKDQLDPGWFCREHALIVGGVASLMGFQTHVATGELCLIGQTQSGPSLLPVTTHSWTAIDSAGFYDFSLNLADETGPGWIDWPNHLLIKSQFIPGDRIEFQMFSKGQKRSYIDECKTALVRAKNDEKHYCALYRLEYTDPVCQDYVLQAAKYINSPLTDDLKRLRHFSDSIYAKAIGHFWSVHKRRAHSLADLPQLEAWAEISKQEDEQIIGLMNAANVPHNQT
jgi:hypothetical protein